ncbi:MAG TPA: TIR domain-containing protein [Solirubrobacteraceae bacterium]
MTSIGDNLYQLVRIKEPRRCRGAPGQVDPFVSSEDIYAGSRWQTEIARRLDESSFGIVCVTRANQSSTWLNFEAGALAKSVDTSRVVPLAVDLKPSDVQVPLGQFQAQPATRDGLIRIVRSINAVLDEALPGRRIEKALEVWLPQIEEALAEIESRFASEDQSEGPTRTERELLEETLDTVRSLASRQSGSAGPFVTTRLAEDHPLIEEVERLVQPYDEEARVMNHTSLRKVGIRSVHLPEDVRAEIGQQAALYGAEVQYLPRRNRVSEILRSRPGETNDPPEEAE